MKGFVLNLVISFSAMTIGTLAGVALGLMQVSLAFTRRQTMWLIILPQCIKRMIPPWMNWYAILTMATPLCSIMGVEEAVRFSQQALEAEGSRPELLMPFYCFLLVIFFVYCYPIARLTIRLEKRFTVNI